MIPVSASPHCPRGWRKFHKYAAIIAGEQNGQSRGNSLYCSVLKNAVMKIKFLLFCAAVLMAAEALAQTVIGPEGVSVMFLDESKLSIRDMRLCAITDSSVFSDGGGLRVRYQYSGSEMADSSSRREGGIIRLDYAGGKSVQIDESLRQRGYNYMRSTGMMPRPAKAGTAPKNATATVLAATDGQKESKTVADTTGVAGAKEDTAAVTQAEPKKETVAKTVTNLFLSLVTDYASNSLKVICGDYFDINHPIQYADEAAIQWELLDETAEIGGYLCNAAMAEFRGRAWKAWFTTEIAVPAGPWKLHGLPGLILKAEDSEGLFSFNCLSVSQIEEPFYEYDYGKPQDLKNLATWLRYQENCYVRPYSSYARGREGARVIARNSGTGERVTLDENNWTTPYAYPIEALE